MWAGSLISAHRLPLTASRLPSPHDPKIPGPVTVGGSRSAVLYRRCRDQGGGLHRGADRELPVRPGGGGSVADDTRGKAGAGLGGGAGRGGFFLVAHPFFFFQPP